MRQVAVAATVGLTCSLAVAVSLALTVTVTMSLRKQDLAHTYCKEAEGRRVLAVLSPTVMAAVWVAPEGRQRGGES